MGMLTEKELLDLQVKYVKAAGERATLINIIFLQKRTPNEAEKKLIASLIKEENEIFKKVTGWEAE